MTSSKWVINEWALVLCVFYWWMEMTLKTSWKINSFCNFCLFNLGTWFSTRLFLWFIWVLLGKQDVIKYVACKLLFSCFLWRLNVCTFFRHFLRFASDYQDFRSINYLWDLVLDTRELFRNYIDAWWPLSVLGFTYFLW